MDKLIIGMFMFSEHEARIIKTILSLNKENFNKNIVLKMIDNEKHFKDVHLVFLNGRTPEAINFYINKRRIYDKDFVVFSNSDIVERKRFKDDVVLQLPVKSEEVLILTGNLCKIDFGYIEEINEVVEEKDEKGGFLGKWFSKKKTEESNQEHKASVFTLNTEADFSDDYDVREEMNEELQKFIDTIKNLFLNGNSSKICKFEFTTKEKTIDLYLQRSQNLVCCSDLKNLIDLFSSSEDIKIFLSFVENNDFDKVKNSLNSLSIPMFVFNFSQGFENSLILELDSKKLKLKVGYEKWLGLIKELNCSEEKILNLIKDNSKTFFDIKNASKLNNNNILKILNLLYVLNILVFE